LRIHILGVAGTFMAGVATIARDAGHDVVGSDFNIYPPMSTLLENAKIPFFQGYDAANIDPATDVVIVGNVISRGNPAMEYVLAQHIPYVSGPEWLQKNVLQKKKVIAVSGTHGKTTTTSLLTWILEYAGLNPGFLIGGIPENFGVSARYGADPFFVIEADEYDSAFFDKRSKFIHYHPDILILNNLEYDHADIFPNLDAIKQQFHYLIRTVPGNGRIIQNGKDDNLPSVLAKGCWTETTSFGAPDSAFRAELLSNDGSHFAVLHQGQKVGEVKWNLLGLHNIDNALAAIAAAETAGVSVADALAALPLFKNVKRRLEVKGNISGITIYDDFAHHPTAIATTLAGLRAKVGSSRIVVVLEFGSHTMRMGVHAATIQASLTNADMVVCKKPEWDLESVLKSFTQPTMLLDSPESIVENLSRELRAGDHVVVMSNSSFGGIHQKLMSALSGSAN